MDKQSKVQGRKDRHRNRSQDASAANCGGEKERRELIQEMLIRISMLISIGSVISTD
jgi:hypothetical protein